MWESAYHPPTVSWNLTVKSWSTLFLSQLSSTFRVFRSLVFQLRSVIQCGISWGRSSQWRASIATVNFPLQKGFTSDRSFQICQVNRSIWIPVLYFRCQVFVRDSSLWLVIIWGTASKVFCHPTFKPIYSCMSSFVSGVLPMFILFFPIKADIKQNHWPMYVHLFFRSTWYSFQVLQNIRNNSFPI